MSRLRRRSRRQAGQAIVELAVATPILLLLSFGVLDLGRVLFAYTALQDAVHEGSLYAAHNPAVSVGDLQTRMRGSSNHLEVAGLTATYVCTTTPAPGTVTVGAHFDYPLITPTARFLFGATMRLAKVNVGTNFEGTCT